jgi:prepilin-type N-terminal cleavage/methylation domain-containing protein
MRINADRSEMEVAIYRRIGASQNPAHIVGAGRDHPRGLAGPNAKINHHTSTIIHPTAFTLIELLVVIAIIALLMALLMPVLSRVRKQARAVVCQGRLKQWGMGFAMYADENEGRLPSSGGYWVWASANSGGDSPFEMTAERLHRRQVLACCPMATKSGDFGQYTLPDARSLLPNVTIGGGATGNAGSVFGAWRLDLPQPPALVGSYGLNEWIFSPVVKETPGRSVINGYVGARVFERKAKGAVPVVLDAAEPWGFPDYADPPPPLEKVSGRFGAFCIDRHNAYINSLFLDWSVRKVGLKELWTLKWHPSFNTAGCWTSAGGVKRDDWPEWMRSYRDY